MNVKFLILFGTFITNMTFLFAQERKLQLSAYTTWDYSNIPESNLIDHRKKLAFGFGIQSNYTLSKRVELIIGAAYIDKGYNEKTTSPGSDDGLETKINHWRYAYFSVPTKLQYNIINKNWKVYLAGGVENDFNFDGNGHYTFKEFAQSIVLNFGISKLISEKARLGLEPTYRNNIQTYGIANGGYRPDLNPYSYGIKIIITKVK